MPVVIDGSNTPTAGGVVYGDGTEYASTAAGTAGQFLQSAGSSAPVWASVASSPTTLITTTTASAASSVNFTGLSSSYRAYIVRLINLVPSTNNAQFYIRTSTNNGSSYDSTSGDYRWVAYYQDTATPNYTGANSATEVRMGASWSSTATNGGGCIDVYLWNPSNASRTNISFTGGFIDGSGIYNILMGGGARLSTTGAVNAVQILPGSGTLTGVVQLIGMT